MCGDEVTYPTPNTIVMDDWIQFQYPCPQLNNLRKRMDFLIKTVMITPSYRYTDLDMKVLKTLKNVLNLEEDRINLSYPKDIGDKPKFLLPQQGCIVPRNKQRNIQNWRTQNGNANNYIRREQHNNCNRENWRAVPNQSTSNGVNRMANLHDPTLSAPNVECQSNNQLVQQFSKLNHNSALTQDTFTRHSSYDVMSQNESEASNSPDQRILDGVEKPCTSIDIPTIFIDPATRLLNGLFSSDTERESENLIKRYEQLKNVHIYLLIKPRTVSNVEIAYKSSKWVFAPQTEKQILNHKEVIIHFSILFTACTLSLVLIRREKAHN